MKANEWKKQENKKEGKMEFKGKEKKNLYGMTPKEKENINERKKRRT